MLKAFASGCAAMTGVEAVSNGVMAFKEPRSEECAQRTLTVIIGILMVLLFGIAYLAKVYGVMAMDPNATQLPERAEIEVAAVFGRGGSTFVTMGSVLRRWR
jgi:amino acid transporter